MTALNLPTKLVDLKDNDRPLPERDRLLEVTAKAADVLLTHKNLDEAIETALTISIAAVGCDRIKVLENNADASSPVPTYSTVTYEAVRPGTMRQMAHLHSRRTTNVGMEAFLTHHFIQGGGFSGLLEKWVEPLRGAMAGYQVKSSCSVPIRVNGQWWGMLALNYCRAAIQINPPEIAVLRTLAACIGSAIQRNHAQQALLEAQQNRSAGPTKANALATHLVSHYSAYRPQVTPRSGGLTQTQLRQVIDYIDTHLVQNISLAELAAVAHLSPYHFTRLFKQSMGMPPHRYHIQCRIDQTKHLLTTENLSLVEISQVLGFASQSHFNYHFKKLTGTTPKQYLKNC